MNIKYMAIASISLLGVAGAATTASASVTTTAVETVGALMIADRLGLQPNVVIAANVGTTDSYYDMEPAFVLAGYSRYTPRQIWAYRKRGWGWDRVATTVGVPIATYNSLNAAHQFDLDFVWGDEFYNRYSIPQAQMIAFRRGGYSWRQIAQGALASQDTQVPIETVLWNSRHNLGYYPAHYRYPTTAVYIPPRASTVVILPARPRYTYWSRPSTSLSIFWSSGSGLSIGIGIRRPIYSYWSPRPIVYGYPYRPIVVVRPPRTYRPPIWAFNSGGIHISGGRPVRVATNIIAERRVAATRNWVAAREHSVQVRRVAANRPNRVLNSLQKPKNARSAPNRPNERPQRMTNANHTRAHTIFPARPNKKGQPTLRHTGNPVADSVKTVRAQSVADAKRARLQKVEAQKRQTADHLKKVQQQKQAQKAKHQPQVDKKKQHPPHQRAADNGPTGLHRGQHLQQQMERKQQRMQLHQDRKVERQQVRQHQRDERKKNHQPRG